jgi:TonB family protein
MSSMKKVLRAAVSLASRIYAKRDRRISAILAFISLSLAGGCASSKLIEKPLLVAPPLPERYLTGNFLEYYPDASKRAHETGEVIVDFSVATNGVVDHIAVNEHTSAPFPRLHKAATQIVQGLNLAVGDNYKTSLSMSIVFEIAPCGNVPHSSGPDYYTVLCSDPVPPMPFQTGPEFMILPEEFKLTFEERKRLRDQMNGYARSVHLPALKASSTDELRVWVGHYDHPAIAGFVVSNSSVRKCTLPADPANSGAGHCSERKLGEARRYFLPLKKLESFNGHRFQCIPLGPLTPQSDARIDIEWVTAGKRFAIQSNEPVAGFCREKPFPLIAKIIANAGWQTLP